MRATNSSLHTAIFLYPITGILSGPRTLPFYMCLSPCNISFSVSWLVPWVTGIVSISGLCISASVATNFLLRTSPMSGPPLWRRLETRLGRSLTGCRMNFSFFHTGLWHPHRLCSFHLLFSPPAFCRSTGQFNHESLSCYFLLFLSERVYIQLWYCLLYTSPSPRD